MILLFYVSSVTGSFMDNLPDVRDSVLTSVCDHW